MVINNGVILEWGHIPSSATISLPISYKLWYKCVSAIVNSNSSAVVHWNEIQMITTALTSLTAGYRGDDSDFFMYRNLIMVSSYNGLT